ncbi:MAG: hypothetical protein L6R38_002248 [Xanthoria sp. 2 TBL-2021]|nr:MAG: hypothetical protein L6R38_002248 [Xanthoria sp. 2 TBL-2021]
MESNLTSGNGNSSSNGTFETWFGGPPADVSAQAGIQLAAFVLNLAVSLSLFAFAILAFFLLKSSAIGRRIYQPKTYLVQGRLRVDAVPADPIRWIRRIFSIRDDELKRKCGLDGYFFIRFLRAILLIFVPLMVVVVTVLLPINYNKGKGNNFHNTTDGSRSQWNVAGLDTLSWQNVDPARTSRYWAHLVCALLVISWSLYRMYREKVHFIGVRQHFLTSPEHRLKASAKTILVTNIPSEYRSKEALEALYDVFVDNDDRSRLVVWVNRDYKSLRNLVAKRRSLRHALEKEELRIMRLCNKKFCKNGKVSGGSQVDEKNVRDSDVFDDEHPVRQEQVQQRLTRIFEQDCSEETQLWRNYLKPSAASQLSLIRGKGDDWKPASFFKFWVPGESRKAPKVAWLRTEIARLTIQIDAFLTELDSDALFKKQNSAFIQFDRQMAAHMACSLVSHNKAGRMSPRFLEVAPHEVVWANMDVTSLGRFIRTCIALVLFVAILLLWAIPTTILGSLSQLASLSYSVHWLGWLRNWPSWILGLISGPLVSILLALLIQLVVPALARKLAVLVGSPTKTKREVITQNFYFTFLFIELVLLTAVSSSVVKIVPQIVDNPVSVPTLLATNIPSSANYFFNYLIVQSLSYSGSVLFQFLRILYITTIWPWFTQTPREEAWLQTTIPHQMWGNVYALFTNFAAIGFIFSVVSPLMLVFVSVTFSLFWVAYRHNYYFVQRNKIDTHGLLFNNALSQLFAGIYVMEIALIGLFLLVRDSDDNVACKAQATIMIVVLILTAAFHFVMEQHLRPLYEFLPVTIEDTAADAEQRLLSVIRDDGRVSRDEESGNDINDDDVDSETALGNTMDGASEDRAQTKNMSTTARNARKALLGLGKDTAARIKDFQVHLPAQPDISRRREVADQLSAAIAGYPDELTDLTPDERAAQLKAAFQDPVTRESAPVIWVPQDKAGISEDVLKQAAKYGRFLQYSNAGAFLADNNKVEVTQPAPDTRPDWLLDWVL